MLLHCTNIFMHSVIFNVFTMKRVQITNMYRYNRQFYNSYQKDLRINCNYKNALRRVYL